MALPFVLAALPAFGLGFLADHSFEHAFILGASALATWTLIQGYRRHGALLALTLLVPGLALLWIGGFVVDSQDTFALHAVLVACGGCCVAAAHLTNMRLLRPRNERACCDKPGRPHGSAPRDSAVA